MTLSLVLFLLIPQVYSFNNAIGQYSAPSDPKEQKNMHEAQNAASILIAKATPPLLSPVAIIKEEKPKVPIPHEPEDARKPEVEIKPQVITTPSAINNATTTTDNRQRNGSKHKPDLDTGTLIRGMWVFLGIGMLFVLYIGIKTCRRNRKSVMVRKYGVRAHRSDVEMEPLPLDDDEDDETLFVRQ